MIKDKLFLSRFILDKKRKICVLLRQLIINNKLYSMERKILQILEEVDKSYPEKDEDFKSIVPKIHLNREALRMVNSYGNLRKLYAQIMIKEGITFAAEKAIIRLKPPILIHDLADAGYHFSEPAMELMRKIRPRSYQCLQNQVTKELP